MVVRRSSSRRRRIAIDSKTALTGDVGGTITSSSSRSRSKDTPDSRAYGFGADRRSQRKTTDLIPKRFLSYSLVVLVLVSCLAGLNFAASHAAGWQSQIGDAGQSAFAIRGGGSLASWFSSFLLIMTGLASLQIYALRLHRCDDYQGTYRLWLWMAVIFVIASVNCIVNLGDVAANLVASFTQQPFGSRPWLPAAIKIGALTLLVARGVYEVRESRGTLALVAVVWIAYCAASLLQMPGNSEQMVGLETEMVIGNCMIFGTAALFLAHLTYGRFIYLQAHGLIKVKPAKEKVAKSKPKKTKKKRATKTADKEATTEKKKSAKPKRKSTRKKTAETVETLEADEVESTDVVTKTKKATKKPAAKKATRKRSATKKVEEAVEDDGPVVLKAEPELKGGTGKKSPSEVLKELAAASRAKQAASQDEDDDESQDDIANMSKSQRRRMRKLQKQQKQQQRRAA